MIPGRQTAGDNADDEKEQARLDTRVPCERGRGLNGQHRRTKNEPLHYSLPCLRLQLASYPTLCMINPQRVRMCRPSHKMRWLINNITSQARPTDEHLARSKLVVTNMTLVFGVESI